jgi:hypothetical protein
VAIAGRQWHLPINGSTNSSAVGEPTGQVGTIGTDELGHWQLLSRRIWLRSNSLCLAMVKVPLDLPAFINAPAANGRLHFVGVNFVGIIGERSR